MDSKTYTEGLERAVIEVAVRSSVEKTADDVAEILECNTSTAREIMLRYRVQIMWLRHVGTQDPQPVADLLHLSYSRDQALRCIGVHTVLANMKGQAEIPTWMVRNLSCLFGEDHYRVILKRQTLEALEVQLQNERALAGVF